MKNWQSSALVAASIIGAGALVSIVLSNQRQQRPTRSGRRSSKKEAAEKEGTFHSDDSDDEALLPAPALTSKSKKIKRRVQPPDYDSSSDFEDEPRIRHSRARTRRSIDNGASSPGLPSPYERRRRQSIPMMEHDDYDLDGVSGGAPWEGFSMEDARKHAAMGKVKHDAKIPSKVLKELQKGNARFFAGKATRPEKSAFERRALIMQQYPSVAILGCSDSRVPIEIVFDQGLGDVFVIRVAGNCLDTTTQASLEYAVHHLKVKVLVVMGHEGCGAIKAALSKLEDIEKEPAMLAGMLKRLKVDLEEDRLIHIHDARAHDREAVVTNVRRQVEKLTGDESIMASVHDGELIIVGAFYEISSGIVDFFHEVSGSDSKVANPLRSSLTMTAQTEANLRASQPHEKGDSPPTETRARAPSQGVQSRYDVVTGDSIVRVRDGSFDVSPRSTPKLSHEMVSTGVPSMSLGAPQDASLMQQFVETGRSS